MGNSISAYKLRDRIGAKKKLKDLGIQIKKIDSCLEVKNSLKGYIEPFLTQPLEGIDTPIDNHPHVVLISAAGATGKTTMCEHLSSTLNIPVFDLGKAREVASNSLTGALLKVFGSSYFEFLESIKRGDQSIIIDALDEGLVKSGTNSFCTFLDDVISLTDDVSTNTIPVVMLGRTQTVVFVSDYLDKKNISYSWLQISAFTLGQAMSYVDMKVNPSNRVDDTYKELKQYVFDAIGTYVKNQSKVNNNFLGYAPVLDAISTAIKQRKNFKALLEEYKSSKTSGISFILSVITEILNREKSKKVNTFIETKKNDLSTEEFSQAINSAYNDVEQCQALLQCIYGEPFKLKISEIERINSEFSEHMKPFIEDHPFLNGKKFENTVFESYVLAKLMIESPDDIYLQMYLEDHYRDAYMLFYFLVELLDNKEFKWEYVKYAYRSLISFDNRDDYGQTYIVQDDSEFVHAIRMVRDKDNKELVCKCDLGERQFFYPGAILSNITIDSQNIDLVLDSNSTEIIPPVVCQCNTISVSNDIFINKSINSDEIDARVIFECENFSIDFSNNNGHRPIISMNDDSINLSINSKNKLFPPFSEYGTDIQLQGDFSEEFKSAFVKLRKILITFRSHSKGSMARCKRKIDASRISGHDVGKLMVERLLDEGIIIEDSVMYYLDRDKTASKLGLSFDKLQTTSPTRQMIDFINAVLVEQV